MKTKEIEKIKEIGDEIDNFKACYDGHELWGRVDECVNHSDLITFLIDNPCLGEIAVKLDKLNRELQNLR